MTVRVLTGITTTGTPHLGNYVGAIRPAIAASRRADVESFLFLADYHALVKCDDPARVEESRLARLEKLISAIGLSRTYFLNLIAGPARDGAGSVDAGPPDR